MSLKVGFWITYYSLSQKKRTVIIESWAKCFFIEISDSFTKKRQQDKDSFLENLRDGIFKKMNLMDDLKAFKVDQVIRIFRNVNRD